jgi:uncharacterized membrane protein
MNPDPTKPQARNETPEREPKPAPAGGASATAQAGSELKEAEAKLTPPMPVTEHLSENVAAPLSYLFGWVSGIVFLLIDRRPFVRFHAAQSVAVFATLSILLLAVSGFFLGALFPHMESVWFVIRRLLELTWLVAAVVLMLKAAGGERVHVRYAGDYAERAAHSAR